MRETKIDALQANSKPIDEESRASTPAVSGSNEAEGVNLLQFLFALVAVALWPLVLLVAYFLSRREVKP